MAYSSSIYTDVLNVELKILVLKISFKRFNPKINLI